MRDSTVLVTGGKGLGRAFTEALGRAGAQVFITGPDSAVLEESSKR